MKELKIQIPDNQEIDWEASARLKQIVLKDKILTYDDVCEELFTKEHYFIGANGKLYHAKMSLNNCPNNASTKYQLECILAKNKLANVARYLNGNWTTSELSDSDIYVICFNTDLNGLVVVKALLHSECTNVIFKSEKLARQAIEILGEDVVKLALEPLY